MPRVMFSISYTVDEEKHDAYLGHIRTLREHLRSTGKSSYTVYNAKGKKNLFTEVFATESLEEYDALEDNQDEKTLDLLQEIEECKVKGTTRYSTLLELEDDEPS